MKKVIVSFTLELPEEFNLKIIKKGIIDKLGHWDYDKLEIKEYNEDDDKIEDTIKYCEKDIDYTDIKYDFLSGKPNM